MKIYQKDVESSAEYILPDYMGEIKKILTVTARTVPTGRFVNESGAEFSGIVNYDVLYTDADGKLSSFSTSSDFSVGCSVPENGEVDVNCALHVAAVSLRPLGARRVLLKSTVGCNMYVLAGESVECAGDAFVANERPEVLKRNIQREDMLYKEGEDKEYSIEAEKLAEMSAEEVEILATSGAVKINEATAIDGGVRVSGDIVITSIIKTPEQPPFAISRTIPFEENVPISEINISSAVAEGYLNSICASVKEEGEFAVITQSARMALSTRVSLCEEAEIVCDAYLKNRNTEGVYENYDYYGAAHLLCTSESFTVGVARADAGIEEVREVIYTAFDLHSVEYELLDGEVKITGEATVSGVACEINDDNEVYIPIKFTSPFSLSVPLDCKIGESTVLYASISAVSATPILESDMLSIKCCVNIHLHIRNKKSIKRMVECNIVGEEEYVHNPAQIKIYYPDAEETLFDIAKKFHTSPLSIALDNGISQQTLAFAEETPSALKVNHLIIK